jgi:hypothetical protein
VSASDFVFAVRLAGREGFDNLIEEVTASVFTQLGFPATTVTGLVTQVRAVVTSGVDGASDLDVQFRAHGGSCEVIVSVRDREIWRASHP